MQSDRALQMVPVITEWCDWMGRGDFAPRPSHTTGRAVFRIRRLNTGGGHLPCRRRSHGMLNPYRLRVAVFSA